MTAIKKEDFGKMSDGSSVDLYTLTNAQGTEVQITNYGARLVSWRVKDKDGKVVDILLGYKDAPSYEKDTASFGALVGRHANRIAGGKILINGKEYQLELNTGSKKQNHIHGGVKGFHYHIWDAEETPEGVKLTYHSKDGEGGYPGNMTVSVLYSLSDDNKLTLDYTAVSDKDTICNLTNHAYFNLDGYASGSVLDQKIQLFSDLYTWADSESLPDGRILSVEGTPMDLRNLTRIGEHIDDDFDQLNFGRGYDHNWVIRKEPLVDGLKKAAHAESDKTGLTLTCYTTQPGVQFYTANWLKGDQEGGKGGATFPMRSAFCLETQFYPNSPANPNFPQPLLKAGDTWKAKTVYQVGLQD